MCIWCKGRANNTTQINTTYNTGFGVLPLLSKGVIAGTVRWHIQGLTYILILYNWYYIYIYIGIVSLRALVFSPFHSSWTRTLLGGVWNVHNFYETCTTSMKRAQLLWNVHNSFETCTTLVKRRKKLLTILYPYIYICMYKEPYVHLAQGER